eukprot:8222735-Karenia_brevis.AAC.1
MAERSSLPHEYSNTPRMQWLMATEELSEQLSTEVLLPSKFTDVDTECVYPNGIVCLKDVQLAQK